MDHVRLLVSRAQQVVRELKDKVPACVLHAVLITWCNGWCTSRRFQQSVGSCKLCSACNGRDELEHYACCETAWNAVPAWVGIPARLFSFRIFLLLELLPSENIVVLATFVFSVYGSVSKARASGTPLSPGCLNRVLQERFRTALQLSSRLRKQFPLHRRR